jgi:cytosine/adenosine deaminase-related metal-dependent hydrolase
MPSWSLSARYLYPVDGPPLLDGILVVQDERISAVEPSGTRRPDLDLGNVAVIPGLVNSHTHLDLGGLRGRCPPSPDFTEWLRGVIGHRRGQTPQHCRDSIKAGIAECLATGTTLVGDIAAAGMSWESLSQAPLRAVVFYELLGLPKDRARQAWVTMKEYLADRPDTTTCRWGVSPHAPYSVRSPLIRAAARTQRPLAIHLAETPAEVELLAHHTGPLREFLGELGAWEPSRLVGDSESVVRLCIEASSQLYIHGNFLPGSIDLPQHATIVYCPRTHAAFGHSPHPFREFVRRGIRIALGTDSLASNPDLDMLSEIRFLHQRYPELPCASLLQMATLAGADALGWGDQCGSLTAGKSADLAVVPLANTGGDPYQLLFESAARVCRTMFRGQWVTPS